MIRSHSYIIYVINNQTMIVLLSDYDRWFDKERKTLSLNPNIFIDSANIPHKMNDIRD